MFECRKSHVIVILITLSIIALILGLGIGLSHRNKKELVTNANNDISPVVTISDKGVETSPETTTTTTNEVFTNSGTFSNAAVASDGKPCAKIGMYVKYYYILTLI